MYLMQYKCCYNLAFGLGKSLRVIAHNTKEARAAYDICLTSDFETDLYVVELYV